MPTHNYKQLHETGIKEIIDKIVSNDIIGNPIKSKNSYGPKTYSSIARAASGMTLVFPVLCTRAVGAETASMISKAIERKCVTMMEMLFAAHQISNVGDVQSFVDQFHKNIKLNKRYTIDDFINFMDNIAESCNINVVVDKVALDALKEDMKNLDFYFEENLDDGSYGSYSVAKNGSLKEGWEKYDPNYTGPDRKQWLPIGFDPIKDTGYAKQWAEALAALDKASTEKEKLEAQKKLNNLNIRYQKARNRREEEQNRMQRDANARDAQRLLLAKDKNRRERENDQRQIEKDNRDAMIQQFNIRQQANKNMLMDNDIKKSNELMPTTLVVAFNAVDNAGNPIKMESIVLGVKAKLIGVESLDITNHLTEYNNNRNILLQLVKATTRETSFVRDFLFAVDKAKIDTLSVSRKGSANPMWKVLEQRANKLRRRKITNGGNDASAITTLVLSKQAEVDFLLSQEDIDIMNPRIAGSLMDGYNFIGIIVVDELLEVVHSMWDDGDYSWEDLSFTSLQKENNNSDMKKVINLMTKMR